MDNRNKVGRPKLADNNLKKKSLIISIICLIVVIVLILTGIKILNIRPSKLKGESAEYKTYEVGEEFCLDTECFYVIEDNGDTITGLAKYNLLVGNIYNTETEELAEISTSTEGYGLQNKVTLFDSNNNVISGIMPFIYYEDDECENNGVVNHIGVMRIMNYMKNMV